MKTKEILHNAAGVQGLILLSVFLVLAGTSLQAVVAVADVTAGDEVTILHRQSVIFQAPWKTSRVAVTDPGVADIKVLTPDQVLIQGLAIGTTDIILWSDDEQQVLQKKVTVALDVDSLRAQLAELFPSSSLVLSSSGENLVIRGTHKNALHVQQLQDFLDKSNISFVDMTGVAGVQQVQLQVRVAEVSKSALRRLGVNWIFAGNDYITGYAPGGLLTDSLSFLPGSIESYDLGNNITTFGEIIDADLAYFLDALDQNQYLRLLAEPSLIALNGETAGFLAGGEFPVPVVQGSSGGGLGTNAISIEYKEYGVRLMFTPTVLGDGTIRLYTAPEVSELDFSSGVTVSGTTVPGLLSRKAETTIELKSGQSFAIAGLLSNTANSTISQIPGLGDLPILGTLFRSSSYQNKESELVILVTASLVEPLNIDAKNAPVPGALHAAPSDWELYIEGKYQSSEPKLDAIDAEWMKTLGLDELHGPGAWDTYGMKTPASKADVM